MPFPTIAAFDGRRVVRSGRSRCGAGAGGNGATATLLLRTATALVVARVSSIEAFRRASHCACANHSSSSRQPAGFCRIASASGRARLTKESSLLHRVLAPCSDSLHDMTNQPDGERFSAGWLGSWKLHAAVLAFSTVGLIQPLRSSAPLIAIYFPGAFIVMAGWSIIRYFRMWSPIDQPVRTNVPVALYLASATTTLFAAHVASDREVYRATALASLWLTIPVVALTSSIFVFRRQIHADHAQIE